MGPTANVVVTSRARPVASSGTGLPATPSTVNVTVPIAATGSTRAVKVTLCPNTDVVRLRVSVVVEAPVLTTWTNVALLPPAKIAEPL